MDDSEVIDTTKNGSSSELEINEILNMFEECDNKEKNDNNIKVEKDLECIPIRNSVDTNKITKNYVLNKPIDKEDIGKNPVIENLLLEIKNDNKNKTENNKKIKYIIEDVDGDGNCALSAIAKALEVDEKTIYNNEFIVNFRNIACDFLLNYDDRC